MMVKTAESMYNQINDPSGLVWVNHSGTDAVPDAVYAGKEANGQEVYVARAMHYHDHDHGLFPGTFVPGLGMHFFNEFSECRATTFQVLTNPNEVQTKWALGEQYRIQPTAVEAGRMGSYTHYIGRTKHQGYTVVGYVVTCDNKENRLFYSLNGTSYDACYSEDFEILLAKNSHDYQCAMNFQLNCSKSCPKKKQ